MIGFTGGLAPIGGFINFNPNWGNIRGGFAAERDRYLPFPTIAQGAWDALKAALGSSRYERGVFDRAGPSVYPVGNGEVSRRGERLPDAMPKPILRTPPQAAESVSEAPEVAVDWGGILQAGVGGAYRAAIGQLPTPYGVPSMEFGPMNLAPGANRPNGIKGPVATMQTLSSTAADCSSYNTCGTGRYLTYDCKTGEFKPRHRRRRRRLLTGRDITDLAALQAIAGKGAALQMAIATAVRR